MNVYENDSRKIVGHIWSVTRNEYLLKDILMDECMMCFFPLFYLEVRVRCLRRDIEGVECNENGVLKWVVKQEATVKNK